MRINPTSFYRRRWGLLPLFAVILVFSEIAFLCRLDMVKNAAMVQNWANSFNFSPASSSTSYRSTRHVLQQEEEDSWCRNWLEKEDNVSYTRDFEKDPVLVDGVDQDWSSCTVGCKFGIRLNKIPDAIFGLSSNPTTATVHRSMESSHYYMENNIDNARRWKEDLLLISQKVTFAK